MTKRQKKSLTRIIIAAVLMIILKFLPVEGWLKFVLYMVPYLVVGYDILRKAFKGILNKQVFDENFLMAVATIGAIALGNYKEGVSVMLFYQIGELFQSYAVGKSRRNISDLMDIRPDYANIEKDGELEQVDPDEVEVGTIIVVQPGEKVPIDGVIEEGSSTLNTSALTGESVPREAAAGDEVISGCINLTGLLKIRTTKEFGESTVSKILDLVENSSSKKSRSENFISKFARYYTPAVCYGALALAILPPLVRMFAFALAPEWGDWIYRALTFLVISCPCALVISIPLSFFAGIGGASHEGVLVKGSNYLETMAQTKYVVFDKTGTMTQGVFEVNGVHHNTMPEEQLLEYAALAECSSSHPISKSLQKAYGKQINRDRVTEIEELSGKGVTAKVDGIPVAAGNAKLMKYLNVEYSECEEVGTIVHVAVNGKYAGHILISDKLKPHAKEAIRDLKKAGITQGQARANLETIAPGEENLEKVWEEFLSQQRQKGFATRQRFRRTRRVMDTLMPYLAVCVIAIAVLAYAGVEYGWFGSSPYGQVQIPTDQDQESSSVDSQWVGDVSVYVPEEGGFAEYVVHNTPGNLEDILRQMVYLGGAPSGTTLLSSRLENSDTQSAADSSTSTYGVGVNLTVELSNQALSLAGEEGVQMLQAMAATFAGYTENAGDLATLSIRCNGEELTVDGHTAQEFVGQEPTVTRTVETDYRE